MNPAVEVFSNLGKMHYDKAVNAMARRVCNRAALVVQDKVRRSINHITHETEQSIQVRDATKHEYYPRAEVYTAIEHAIMLEFHQAPFMRPGARKARRYIRKIIREEFGAEVKARIKSRGRPIKVT